jgi:hypothetical protein
MSVFILFENDENWVQKNILYVILKKRCHDCPKTKIPHIVHHTNHIEWINIEWIKTFLVNMDLIHKNCF